MTSVLCASGVRGRWFPPPPNFNENYTEGCTLYGQMLAGLRTDTRLERFVRDVYPEIAGDGGAAAPPLCAATDAAAAPSAAELLAVGQVLGVMELGWLGVQLEGYYSHPLNRGWMNAFRRSSAMNVPVQPWSMKPSMCLLSSMIWSSSAWSK